MEVDPIGEIDNVEKIVEKSGNNVNSPEVKQAMDQLRQSLTDSVKGIPEVKLPTVTVENGKVQFMGADGQEIKFDGNSYGDFMSDQAQKVAGGTDANQVAEEATKTITKSLFGIESDALNDAYQPRVAIDLSIRSSVIETEAMSEANINTAENTFSKDTLNLLSSPDPEAQAKGAQQAAQEFADKMSKTTVDLDKRMQELNGNVKELQQRIDKMVEDAKTPAEKEATKSWGDTFKDFLKYGTVIGVAGYFGYSYLHNLQIENSGCFVTVYDATSSAKVSYGKVSDLTCGNYVSSSQDSVPDSDQVITSANCVKNADGSYPQAPGCPNNCFTDFSAGITALCACSMDPKGGSDKVCTKYCDNAFMKSTNPKYRYDFKCAKPSLTEAAGQAIDNLGKLLADEASALWDSVKIYVYVLLGIIVLVFVIFLGIKIWELFQTSKQNVETSQQLSKIDISEKDQKSKLNVEAYKQKQQLGGGESLEMAEIPKQSPTSSSSATSLTDTSSPAVAEVVNKFGYNRINKRVSKRWYPM
jgi:hypothetical protein